MSTQKKPTEYRQRLAMEIAKQVDEKGCTPQEFADWLLWDKTIGARIFNILADKLEGKHPPVGYLSPSGAYHRLQEYDDLKASQKDFTASELEWFQGFRPLFDSPLDNEAMRLLEQSRHFARFQDGERGGSPIARTYLAALDALNVPGGEDE